MEKAVEQMESFDQKALQILNPFNQYGIAHDQKEVFLVSFAYDGGCYYVVGVWLSLTRALAQVAFIESHLNKEKPHFAPFVNLPKDWHFLVELWGPDNDIPYARLRKEYDGSGDLLLCQNVFSEEQRETLLNGWHRRMVVADDAVSIPSESEDESEYCD